MAPTALPPRARLVGREDELRTLLAMVTSPPAMVSVRGEAGSGKTRLITALVDALDAKSRWLSIGRCQPLRAPFPFGPVLDSLRTCRSRLATAAELSPVTGVLRTHLPEIADVLPAAPEPLTDPAAERHRLFRAVRDLLAALGPGVLVLEDLHWADEGTRQLLRYLLSYPPEELAVVLTYRPEELPAGAHRPGTQLTTTRLRLDPLDVPGVRELVAEILGVPTISWGLATALHEQTGGIPAVVEELAHALDATVDVAHVTGHTARQRLEAIDTPVGLREAMTERLAALPDDARQLSQAAAVLGAPATADLLGELARTGRDRTRAALIQALAAGILIELDDNRYGFRHAMGQRVVYETLPGPHRQDLHLRAVRALRKVEPVPLRQLAEHSRRAGRAADWLSYGEAAADSAAVSGDTATASGLLEQLLGEPALRAADRDRLATKLGRITATGLDQVDVSGALERLMHDGSMSGPIRGEIRLGLGVILVRQADGLQASRIELELAASELRPHPALAARAMSLLGLPYVGTTPLTETMRWMRQVEDTIQTLRDSQWRTMLLANVLGSRLITGDHTVWQQIAQLPDHVDNLDEQRQLARLYCNLADSCAWIGHYDKANGFLRTGLRLAEDSGAPYVINVARSTQLHLDWLTGNWTGLADRSTALLDSCHDLMPVTTELSLVLGSLALAGGEWEAAERHLANTGMSTPDNAITPVAIDAFGTSIALRLSTDDIPGAVAEADRGVALLRAKGVWSWAGEIAFQAVTAYCLAGRLDAADALTAELDSSLTGIDAPLAHAALAACRAELAAARGQLPAAIDAFGSAKRLYDVLPRPYLALRLAERGISCRLQAGDPDAATGLADLAEELEQLGATRDAAHCRHLTRTAGAAAPSRRGRRGYGNDLSPRERDVARLLAGGHTNREIADILFLSRRTVEQHVANILRKLGLKNRQELGTLPES